MVIELAQNQMWKSIDNEYVYNIFSYQPNQEKMILDIYDKDLNFISTKYNYPVSSFLEQINGTCNVIPYVHSDDEKTIT